MSIASKSSLLVLSPPTKCHLTQESEIPVKHTSKSIIFLFETLNVSGIVIKVKFFIKASKAAHDPALGCFSAFISYHSFSHIVTSVTRASLLFLDNPNTHPAQSLCTCYSFCLNCSSLRKWIGKLPNSLGLVLNKTWTNGRMELPHIQTGRLWEECFASVLLYLWLCLWDAESRVWSYWVWDAFRHLRRDAM